MRVLRTSGHRAAFATRIAPRTGATPFLVLAALALAALGLAPRPAAAQSLADRVAAAPDGAVRMSFAARPGVCSWHGGGISVRDAEDATTRATDRVAIHAGDPRGPRDCGCVRGPVRVLLRREAGRVTAIRTRVGEPPEPDRGAPARDLGAAAPARELGRVAAAEAADYFLGLAARLDGEAAEDAILPAVIADSATVWPGLLAIAKDDARPASVRKKAVFWVGQAAADAATAGLEEIAWSDADRSVREHAVFALSRRPDREGVPALIRIVRENPDPGLRRKAIFWLGRSEDPRALALFEELLTRR